MNTGDLARVALAGIRMTNGAIAIVAPSIITRRFNAPGETEPHPAAVYALRMFGIRTVLVALDLLHHDASTRAHAVRVAPIVHATDLCTAILISRSPRVSQSTGRIIVAISGLNTLLAFVAHRQAREA